MRTARLVAPLALLAALAAAPRAEARQPETTAGLKGVIDELLAAGKAGDVDRAEAIARGLVLPAPQAWFGRVFGAARAPRLVAEYRQLLTALKRDLDARLTQLIKEHRTTVRVTALRRPDDAAANGNQQRALRAMRTKVALYSVRLTRGERTLAGGIHFYSFVYVDGAFRFVGKLRAIKD